MFLVMIEDKPRIRTLEGYPAVKILEFRSARNNPTGTNIQIKLAIDSKIVRKKQVETTIVTQIGKGLLKIKLWQNSVNIAKKSEFQGIKPVSI